MDLPLDVTPDPDEFIRAAMLWHFDPETGSPFWVERAKKLSFDPRSDVRTFEDLRLFPNVTDEIRDVPTQDLIPKGFGPRPDVVSVIESGGTTGAPKRLPMLREFANRLAVADAASLTRYGLPKSKHWLCVFPSGPHGAYEQARRASAVYGDGVLVFGIDMDPRWVKKQIAAGNAKVVEDYVGHIIEQVTFVLRSQDVGVLRLTPPVLHRLAERDDLVDLIREKITHITWGGAHMDPDSRHFLCTEVFPGINITGGYGTTMALGAGAVERPGLSPEDPCIFEPTLPPFVTFNVVDPDTGDTVDYGERGQVVFNHVSKSFFLPNNAERDLATRVMPLGGQIGDCIADIAPMARFGDAQVIEGVY
ncbi:hypothetical protein [Sinomonas sp. G460-2]|uniref:hypothetical protein n=1 Tax=Sinomonas sp. G460-2 TaxID=3393464 RepID=UPI0039F13FB3